MIHNAVQQQDDTGTYYTGTGKGWKEPSAGLREGGERFILGLQTIFGDTETDAFTVTAIGLQ